LSCWLATTAVPRCVGCCVESFWRSCANYHEQVIAEGIRVWETPCAAVGMGNR
jgi:hypothetical protein